MTKKKQASKAKRPPRRLWILVDGRGSTEGPYLTRKAAADEAWTDDDRPLFNDRVVGPYVLAEDP